MKVLESRSALGEYISEIKTDGKTIGFAPTMGALHAGHLSLYAAARPENDVVISSIFVNPTQFNDPKDLEKYPRTVEQDIEKLKESGLVDAVYLPSVEDIYPNGAISEKFDFGGLENEMEGASRPGHFDGVGTVVKELFQQVLPDNAYFGEKDFQQLAIISKMVSDEKIPVKIRSVEIKREENGLAMSSRNMRLNPEMKEKAALIYETLVKVKDWFRIISIPEIKKRVQEIFEKEEAFDLEYFIIADEETLKETDFFYAGKSYRAFIAVWAEGVRLIDNMHLE
ncbi:pantoate--beta-alanine ligase [Cruoricaptor ignavus]|uniref:pantoate--beta-alanine ligase n=1 Tax=Cruoricaptor ignavus TaxID=1118202 RepID=UPI00370DD9E3